MKHRTRATRAVVAAATISLLAVASPASAAGENCWGVVTSQRAQVDGAGFGGHSSSFATPRLGLGNTARALGFDSVAELGAFLASVDGIDETTC